MIQPGQIWMGRQHAHRWRVRVLRITKGKGKVLGEVIAGPSHALKRRLFWPLAQFLHNYAPR